MDNDIISLQHKIDNFLFKYRNAVHATTSQTSVMMFFKRNLRSCMDLIKPDVRQDMENKQFSGMKDKCTRTIRVGQEVLARDYRMEKWQPGTIITRTGLLTYIEKGDNTWRHHVAQLLDCQVKSTPFPVSKSNDRDKDAVDISSPASVNVKDSDPHDSTPDVTIPIVPEPHQSSQRRYPEISTET